ncbi:TlpA disulfide reductase family protein [uncultured Roseivirga sp.]|uniref:TlpA disulfide reductase family protein n=1 Tax=uncultured Roseivirga sp. TaxID=543088 RepID=UPI0030D9ED74|tara:strand:+ start:28722 stop:29885 length:1164 start_codon:yes stop_codon:yes gene_type:complete
MKNLLQKTTSLLVLTAVLFACKPEVKVAPDSFTVTGTIEGLDTEYMSRSYKDAEGNRVSDSIFVENGKFTYTAKISEPEFIVFWPNVENTIKRTDRGYYPAKSSQFAFLAAPGDYIEFKGEVTDFVDAYPTGTPANDDLASINSKIFPLLNQAVNMQLEQNKLEDTDPRYQVLTDSMNLLNEKVDEMKKEFVASNPKSEAAAWYLSDMMVRSQVSQDEAIKIFKSFDKGLAGYTYYEAVAQRVEGIESTMEGKIIPNFTSNATPNGETFELYSLKGKYVLVDFWGTWCAPCIAEMPTVKEYQEKYKDQLVILGINSGDSMEKMVQFLDKYDYDWQQVLAQNETEDLVLKLNVAGFPTKFILDPEGKIIKRFVGSTEEAFDVLDEILE